MEDIDDLSDVAVATEPGPRAALWYYREAHTEAINTLGSPHKLDVTLPDAALAEFVDRVPEVVRTVDPAARTWLFGHVGDGNVHYDVLAGEGADQAAHKAARDAAAELVHGIVMDMGGSISAEHGLGTMKTAEALHYKSPVEVAALRAVRAALDPKRIMNPRVLF